MKIRWLPLPIVVVLLYVPRVPAAEGSGAEPAGPAVSKTTAKPLDEEVLKKDLEQLQGVWVRSERSGLFSSTRITKEIQGDTETVTYYDSDGKVREAHTVKVKLRRAGPIRIFGFSDQVFTAGPNKGTKDSATKAYLYKIVGNTFVEIWGTWDETTTELTVREWKREKGGK
jgi:hypothetical protein